MSNTISPIYKEDSIDDHIYHALDLFSRCGMDIDEILNKLAFSKNENERLNIIMKCLADIRNAEPDKENSL